MNQLDRTKQPVTSPCGVRHLTKPELHKLSNGINVYAFPGGSQDVIRLDIVVDGGYWIQDRTLQANTTNSMLREGCMKYTSQEISEALEFYGAWLNLLCNNNYSLLTLYCMGRYFKETIAIIQSMISEPTFPEKEFKMAVLKNKQSYKISLSKMNAVATRAFMKHHFGEQHPGGRFACEEDYDTLTTDDLRRFFKSNYHPENMRIYMSGNVTDDKMKVVNQYLGQPFGAPDFVKYVPQFIPALPDVKKQVFLERDFAVQSCIRMGCTVVGKSHPDYVKLTVLNTMFGGFFGSRLMTNIREDKGYTYGIFSSITDYYGEGLLLVATEADNTFVPAIIDETYHEIDRLQQTHVDVDELDMVKNYMLGEMCRVNEGPFAPNDIYNMLHSYNLQPEFFEHVMTEVKDVTPDEIQDLACKYLKKECMLEVIAGKKI